MHGVQGVPTGLMHGLKATFDYVGRVMYIQQQGVARSDIAIYHKESWVKAADLPFNTTALEDAINGGK
jgi:hypothetical protein